MCHVFSVHLSCSSESFIIGRGKFKHTLLSTLSPTCMCVLRVLNFCHGLDIKHTPQRIICSKFGPQLVDAIIERWRDFEDSQWINPLVGSESDGITRRWYILSEVRPSYMKEVVSLGPIPGLGVFVFPSSPSFLPSSILSLPISVLSRTQHIWPCKILFDCFSSPKVCW